jgi:hypothetical protein
MRTSEGAGNVQGMTPPGVLPTKIPVQADLQAADVCIVRTVRQSRYAVLCLKTAWLCFFVFVAAERCGLCATNAPSKAPGKTAVDEKFDSLRAGTNVYSKVTVLNKTRNDVFISHAQGMASIKVRDLDDATQLKLGYQVEPPRQTAVEKVIQASNLRQLQRVEDDPRVQEVEEHLVREAEPYIQLLDENTTHAIVAFVVLSYLLFSFLCRCICVKTSNPPSPLIWIPFFKQIPLFKAAGMSGWWILSNFVPGLFLIAYIIWSFRIAQSRAKSVVWGVLLLLPVTNILAFLYLALSGDGKVKPGRRNVISLQQNPRRDAA